MCCVHGFAPIPQAGVSEDVEIPPFPGYAFTPSGTVDLAKSHNFSDLDWRIGNVRASVAPLWPPFVDWPVKGGHRIAGVHALSMEDIEYNMAVPSVDLARTPGYVTFPNGNPCCFFSTTLCFSMQCTPAPASILSAFQWRFFHTFIVFYLLLF